MPDRLPFSIRKDCLASLQLQPQLPLRLDGHRIAVIGGTGFAGTWLAEMVAAINDEYGSRLQLDLLGRSVGRWSEAYPHLAQRHDVHLAAVDVRSALELPPDTTLVLYAAGIADPAVHASDPYCVHETALRGMAHALAASARLESVQRILNLSSGLVLGREVHDQALKEDDIGIIDFTRAHNVYAESRRAAENLVNLYASQYRVPVATARAFTFLGPFQPLDAPWAVNNFVRDALLGNDIRLHGDGATRRSYLYGSDVAAWLLRMLIDGQDGAIYNLGGAEPISHSAAAAVVAERAIPTPQVVYKCQPASVGRRFDFFPDLRFVQSIFGLRQAFTNTQAIERLMQWHAHRLGVARRLRSENCAT